MKVQILLLLSTFGAVWAQNNQTLEARKWRLVPAARGARTIQSPVLSGQTGLIEQSGESEPKLVTLEDSRPIRQTHKNPELLKESQIEDITRLELQTRRRGRKIGRKGRRIDERLLEGRGEKPTTETPSIPTTAIHRLQSKRRHFVIQAPTPPDATRGPIVELSNGTTPHPSSQSNPNPPSTGSELKRDTESNPSGIRVETGPSGTPTLEISPENLPDEYRRLLAKGYHSYPTFDSKNYKRPPEALFEANLVPSMNMPPPVPSPFAGIPQQIPTPFQRSQPIPGVQIFPGAQGGSFVIPQGVGGQNVNLNLLARARQLLALREFELIKAKQDLLVQQARQAQFQQFAGNRLGRAIDGQPAQGINGQIDPMIMAELHRRQLFTAQLMAQAQQRAYPEGSLLQPSGIPQNLAPPPQFGAQFGAPFLAPMTQDPQESPGMSRFQPRPTLDSPTATFLQNGQQMRIPVVFKRAAPKSRR